MPAHEFRVRAARFGCLTTVHLADCKKDGNLSFHVVFLLVSCVLEISKDLSLITFLYNKSGLFFSHPLAFKIIELSLIFSR
jgi:hypothetical protein